MKRNHAIVVAIIVAALISRVAVLPLAMGREPDGDPANYVAIAESMIAGTGMLLIEDGLTYFAYYPPLYPTLLAAVGLLVPLEAPTFLAIGFLTDLAIAASMVWLGKLLNANSAPNAAAIYLFWPTAVLMSPIAHKEGLVTLVVLLLIACWLNASKNRFAAAFGALSGVLALTQPSLVLLPAALMLFLRRQSWRRVGIALTAAAIVILPWWIRNFLVFGQFVPLTSGSGFALWVGSTPEPRQARAQQ